MGKPGQKTVGYSTGKKTVFLLLRYIEIKSQGLCVVNVGGTEGGTEGGCRKEHTG